MVVGADLAPGIALGDAVQRVHALPAASRKRARPIEMTTIAMVAGMVPCASGVGVGGEFRAPMAQGVIGGLIVSTLLSLVFVPSFYTVRDDLSRLVTGLFGRSPATPPAHGSVWQRYRPPTGRAATCPACRSFWRRQPGPCCPASAS